MRLNRKLQLGLLLVLYLCRSGRTTLASAAEGLKAPRCFLEQVARTLRIKGVLRSVKGPGGGYELVGEPTVFDVFQALVPVALLTKAEKTSNLSGGHERRALNHLAVNLTAALAPVMNRKVKNVGAELVASDMATMNKHVPASAKWS